MTVDEAIARVLQYHGCGHPVTKAAGVLRLEVERLRKEDAPYTASTNKAAIITRFTEATAVRQDGGYQPGTGG
ncbi:MAG: hypothetical protein WC277_07135 [Bacilli bacterium]